MSSRKPSGRGAERRAHMRPRLRVGTQWLWGIDHRRLAKRYSWNRSGFRWPGRACHEALRGGTACLPLRGHVIVFSTHLVCFITNFFSSSIIYPQLPPYPSSVHTFRPLNTTPPHPYDLSSMPWPLLLSPPTSATPAPPPPSIPPLSLSSTFTLIPSPPSSPLSPPLDSDLRAVHRNALYSLTTWGPS